MLHRPPNITAALGGSYHRDRNFQSPVRRLCLNSGQTIPISSITTRITASLSSPRSRLRIYIHTHSTRIGYNRNGKCRRADLALDISMIEIDLASEHSRQWFKLVPSTQPASSYPLHPLEDVTAWAETQVRLSRSEASSHNRVRVSRKPWTATRSKQ